MSKAIVFNCHYNGLSIIQELGRYGINCVAMDDLRSIGTYSKYAIYVKCPNPSSHENSFIDFLYNYCKQQKYKPVLFPTNDPWAVAISKYKDILQEVAIPCVSNWNTVRVLIEKNKFYEIGQEKKYLTPKTLNTDSLKKLSHNDFPIIAKPIYRRISSNEDQTCFIESMDRLRLTVFNNKEELSVFMDEETSLIKHLIFQEYLPGLSDSMYTVGIYADALNEIKGLFTGRKVRGYPADIGNCIVGENHELPNYVIENTKRIVIELNYTGIAEFEYKLDLKTNRFRLIEVNPRSWSWIGITPSCGVNLPMIAYKDLTGAKQKYFSNISISNGDVRYVKVIEDFINCLFLYKNNHDSWHMDFINWVRDYSSVKTMVRAEFNASDWRVAIVALWRQMKSVIQKMLYNFKILKHKSTK